MSQTALGNAIGRVQQAIAGYETGANEPDLATFGDLAKALGVSPVWLVYGIRMEPEDEDLGRSLIEAHGEDHLFARTFANVARMLTEEGLDADLPFTVRLTQKLLRGASGVEDAGAAWELIRRAIEVERAEISAAIARLRASRI